MTTSLLTLYWVLYFAIHSLLATDTIKVLAKSKTPSIFPYYRIAYNVIAIVGLAVLLRFTLPLASLSADTFIGGVITGIGLLFIVLAFRAFNLREFLGFQTETKSELVVTGMYRFVRHPLYFGTMIFIAGLYLLMPSHMMLYVLVISYVYIWVGSRLEERKLRALFGESYSNYAKKVKSLIPYVY
ncbi:methyltransferase family protein [Aquirufa regiilacus]|uniref:Isoprenylcysteine carboxylmethyltransferase family protein n=1 Tax=Aquirufa regiilacus TaxID=3024868 RepID=A0ABU3TTK6_9BACT|nr:MULTISPECIES: isoprenylcysteine carboxylmethyltransferase family protein [unclassified Aquirufa]MDT8886133.1 isoprenylcysteine carboxylmethyltransferase family protein [Aquirufa sp. LEPPI-3A]MDU0809195.1 isoprenylcysteine carboxylmethyltransferase family protein [Aquirufa sp. LEOWEIH-7C]